MIDGIGNFDKFRKRRKEEDNNLRFVPLRQNHYKIVLFSSKKNPE